LNPDLKRLEDTITIQNHRVNYTPEEKALLQEISRRAAQRIRKDRIQPGDKERLQKIARESAMQLKGEKMTPKGNKS
jgi:hypothetical protein